MQKSVERGGQVELFFDDGDEQVDGDGDPDLSFDGVLAGPVESLDAQMLLDPFEQQADILPINIIVPMKSRFTILFTPCARTGYR